MPGLTTGTIKGKLGVRAGNTGEPAFNNVRIPLENRIGEEGEGFKIAMSCIDQGASPSALARWTHPRLSRRQHPVRERALRLRAGDRPLRAGQADDRQDGGRVRGPRLLTMQAAELKNRGIRNTRETSLMKWYGCDAALEAANDAIQIHGSYGYSNEYPVERFWRNARGAVIYEGTREIHTILQADYALGYRQDKPLRCPQPPAEGFERQDERVPPGALGA